MVLTSVRPGDIVKVDKKGRIFLAEVTRKEKGQVELSPISPNINYFSATSREVVAHYKRMGRGK